MEILRVSKYLLVKKKQMKHKQSNRNNAIYHFQLQKNHVIILMFRAKGRNMLLANDLWRGLQWKTKHLIETHDLHTELVKKVP